MSEPTIPTPEQPLPITATMPPRHRLAFLAWMCGPSMVRYNSWTDRIEHATYPGYENHMPW